MFNIYISIMQFYKIEGIGTTEHGIWKMQKMEIFGVKKDLVQIYDCAAQTN